MKLVSLLSLAIVLAILALVVCLPEPSGLYF